MTTLELLLAGICAFLLVWDMVLTAAMVAQRHRHDRLTYRVGTLARSVTKVGRLRHTGTQPAVTGSQASFKPPPPFPVPPPSTNPIASPDSAHGRHASP